MNRQRVLYIVACAVLLCFFSPLKAQEGRYGHFKYDMPPSDLELEGIYGNVRKIVSYEGMAVRTNKGVVFSEDPLKVVTLYNRDGNITRQSTYRYGKLIERVVYAYDSKRFKISKKTVQANGLVSSTVRFFNDPKSSLNVQQNSYNYSGKMTQKSVLTYNANRKLVLREDYNNTTNYRSEAIRYLYDEENRLVDEKDYQFSGRDSLMYYTVHYSYNSRGNVLMYDHHMFDNAVNSYNRTIIHYRYYQYDKENNWCIRCSYFNALEVDKRLIPKTIMVREITYY